MIHPTKTIQTDDIFAHSLKHSDHWIVFLPHLQIIMVSSSILQPISINQAAWLGLAQLSPEPERNSCDRRAVRVTQTNSSRVRE